MWTDVYLLHLHKNKGVKLVSTFNFYSKKHTKVRFSGSVVIQTDWQHIQLLNMDSHKQLSRFTRHIFITFSK